MTIRKIHHETYEVVRFVEHGGRCRVVMDCVPGTLLVYRLLEKESITRSVVLEWFHMLAAELDKCQRARRGQCYRYLNPYSVLVTENERIRLLDLSAASNDFVFQILQRPVMREHFIKPAVLGGGSSRAAVDLYCMGKTMQYVLSQTERQVEFTRREEYVLQRVIEKCLGEKERKNYENLKQVQRELPKVPMEEKRVGRWF